MASISDYVANWFCSNNNITTNLTETTVVSKEYFSSIDTDDDGFEIIGVKPDANLPGPDDYWINLESTNPSDEDDDWINLESTNPPDEDDDWIDLANTKLPDEGEIDLENINPPDEGEKRIPASDYKNNGNVMEIAGFSQDKLIEMCTFSKMTYGNDDNKLFWSGYKTKEEFLKEGYSITPFYHRDGTDAGLVFAKSKEVTIAYHGTKGLGDIATDINALFVAPSFLPEYGRVHRGFYNAFESSFESLESILENLAKEQGLEIKDLKIYITGHSMGGAIAKIAALCLNKTQDAQDIHIATFGDPRVYDLYASDIYNKVLGKNTVRVTQHRQDPVPAVAPGCAGYAHVGAQLRVEKSPHHCVHKIDGYYDAIRTMKKCDFKSNNDVSLFYYLARPLGMTSCEILGNLQCAITKFFIPYLSETERKWYEKAEFWKTKMKERLEEFVIVEQDPNERYGEDSSLNRQPCTEVHFNSSIVLSKTNDKGIMIN